MKQEGQVSLRALEDSSAAAADSWVCVGGHLIIVTWGQRPSLLVLWSSLCLLYLLTQRSQVMAGWPSGQGRESPSVSPRD